VHRPSATTRPTAARGNIFASHGTALQTEKGEEGKRESLHLPRGGKRAGAFCPALCLSARPGDGVVQLGEKGGKGEKENRISRGREQKKRAVYFTRRPPISSLSDIQPRDERRGEKEKKREKKRLMTRGREKEALRLL